MSANDILALALSGGRIDAAQALAIWEGAELHSLAHVAHELRASRARPQITYVVDRNINYTNVCSCGCTFCAFFRGPGHAEGYVLPRQELAAKIQETLKLGGTQILMQGGHHPDLPLGWYEEMLGFIRQEYPQIHVHAFSPPEIIYWSRREGLTPAQVITRLKAAGLASIPGGGAEILVDRVRTAVAPNKCSSAEWLEVMRQAHLQGLKTTATMMFGHVETPAERIEHLLALRALQDETGGFTAFIPWAFQPDNTVLGRSCPRKATSPEYLRMVALSRLVLDNFANIQASWVTMGPKVAQMSLFCGANDMGSTMIEENVVKAAGVGYHLAERELRRLVYRAGLAPARRRMDYSLAGDDPDDSAAPRH